MDYRSALKQAYALLSPYSDKQLWEFNNNLTHLDFLTRTITKDLSIFDAGCGIGILDLALTLLGYRVEGGDKYLFTKDNPYYISDLDKLQQIWNTHQLKITNKDIITENFEKKYDVIISIATIEHQKDPKNFLKKIIDNTRSGGYIYIATPNLTHLLNRIRFFCGRAPLGNLADFFENGENFNGHWREYTLFELKGFYHWLNVDIIEARNIQSIKPNFNFKNLRDLHVNFFRLLSYLFPGCRDTNIILVKNVARA